MRKITLLFLAATTAFMSSAAVKPLSTSVCKKIEEITSKSVPSYMEIGKVTVNKASVDTKQRKITVSMNDAFAYIPFTQTDLDNLEKQTQAIVGQEYSKYKVTFITNGRVATDYLYESKLTDNFSKNRSDRFIYPLDESRHATKGLDGKVIAVWQSHGWYYNQEADRWQWQRARIFQTVEDLFTQSFVIPFLMPMLENAGAYVMSPRERDTQTVELIIDEDSKFGIGRYTETGNWKSNDLGFAHYVTEYQGVENPFAGGTYRSTKANANASATWTATIPQPGKYAVYVSYASLPNSATDAVYTIRSASGESKYRVNQQMGGSTWIYLGHFYFNAGEQTIVELSGKSADKNAVITADAVKIGGGMGNIARRPNELVTENIKSSENKQPKEIKNTILAGWQTSGYPRFTEGARYWLQWAGFPDSIYSPTNGSNDYTDDYKCRGMWVNYLAGGSKVLPNRDGLKIPVDLSFAFHSDAGTTMDNTIIGTLGIYSTSKTGKFANGSDRLLSHKLTNYVLTNITKDVQAQFDSQWVRRGMWNKSYFEARVPEVPAMLLELLSHQNLADMRYGLDPTFRFTVSRAIYKGMVEYFANQEGRTDYEIQPLPVNSFAISKESANTFRLSWKATTDTLCDRADAKRYYIYERVGEGGFKRIAQTEATEYKVTINDNEIHSYQIVAANDGGLAFPSETLALGIAPNSKGDVAIVNGFTRISAPDSFVSDGIAGFRADYDNGVPYMQDISYIGAQYEFRRALPWISDDSCGFGTSHSDYETDVIAGNTFDFAFLHGQSILAAGYSFVSTSMAAVENGFDLSKYKTTDIILGKQKTTVIGRGEKPDRFAIFSPATQNAIKAYCKNGGNVFVSGAYVASDIWDNNKADDAKKEFAEKTLGYKWVVNQAAVRGKARVVNTTSRVFSNIDMTFAQKFNDKVYAVESPDALKPADKNGCTLMRYSENGISAGIIAQMDGYKTCVLGFPFETINEKDSRDTLMMQILNYFDIN